MEEPDSRSHDTHVPRLYDWKRTGKPLCGFQAPVQVSHALASACPNPGLATGRIRRHAAPARFATCTQRGNHFRRWVCGYLRGGLARAHAIEVACNCICRIVAHKQRLYVGGRRTTGGSYHADMADGKSNAARRRACGRPYTYTQEFDDYIDCGDARRNGSGPLRDSNTSSNSGGHNVVPRWPAQLGHGNGSA